MLGATAVQGFAVDTDGHRGTADRRDPGHRLDDLFAPNALIDIDGQGLAGEGVDHGQRPQASAVEERILADDLFINYDDARSAAGFRVLAKLAEHTQVIFFTHHEHLSELARESLQPANVSICRLGELRMEAA